MSMARLWRLDIGEDVFEIEKFYEVERSESLPIYIRGRILSENEVIEDINVADNDVLLYEVKLIGHLYLQKNNLFAFVPKSFAEKERKQNNFVLKNLGKQ